MNDDKIRQQAGDHSLQIANVENLSFAQATPRFDVPCQAEPLPSYYVERPVELARIRRSLHGAAKSRNNALVISAIHGLGGIGKTTLAAALAEQLRPEFPGGTLWAKLGQTPDLLSAASGWIQALGDHQFRAPNLAAASAHLRTLLRDRRVLLVIDDAWSGDAVRPFLAGGPGCVTIITTRRETVAQEIGAHLESVDVLTRPQALELLALRLGRTLRDDERAAASDLAEAVGDLPMALELAATQMLRHPNLTWQALTSEIAEEIARLEALDNAEDRITGYVKLEATFNTSLHHVRAQSETVWECFVWLGITMEDSTIAAPMAATLWDVNVRKAQDILQYLRSEALLIYAGVTNVGKDEFPAFHLHDLLLDVARRAIVRARPEGLGIEYPAAHREYLRRVRRYARGGWSGVGEDGYVVQHLSWHMLKANRAELLDELLREENASRENAWYVRRLRDGQLGGYVEDVIRAWDASTRNASLAADGFYALVRSTINSVAEHLPVTLLARMVGARKWTPLQALTYAMHIPGLRRRATALVLLLPVLNRELRTTALRTLRQWIDQSMADPITTLHLREVFQSLAHYVPAEDLPIVLSRFDEFDRISIIEQGASRFSHDQAARCLSVVQQLRDEVVRWRATLALVPALPKSERRSLCRDAQARVLELPKDITWQLLETLATLAPDFVTTEHLLRLSRPAAERVIRQFAAKLPRGALSSYAMQLAKRHIDRAALELFLFLRPFISRIANDTIRELVASRVESSLSVPELAPALVLCATELSEETLREVVESCGPGYRADLLLGTVLGNPGVPAQWKRDASEALVAPPKDDSIAFLMTAAVCDANRETVEDLAPRLPPAQRAHVLATLITTYPDRQGDFLDPFLESLSNVEKKYDFLKAVADVLTPRSTSIVLRRIARDRRDGTHVELLLKLAMKLTGWRELVDEIVSGIESTSGVKWRIRQLEALSAFVPANEIVRLRERFAKELDPSEKIEIWLAIIRISSQVPPELVSDIFEQLERVTGDRQSILELMCRLLRDEDLMRILESAQKVGSVSEQTLADFMKPGKSFSQRRQLVRTSFEEFEPADDLPRAQLPIVGESPSLVSAIAIPDASKRAVAMSQHIRATRGASPDKLLAMLMTLTRVRGLAEQVNLLVAVLPTFDETMISLTADWILTRPERDRPTLLKLLLPHVTPVTFPDIFRVWIALGPTALGYADSFLTHVPDYWVLGAIQSLRQTPDDLRSVCIVGLIDRLHPSELTAAAAEVASIENPTYRRKALEALAFTLEPIAALQRRAIARTLLRALSMRSRHDMFDDLNALTPVLARDGEDALDQLRKSAALVFRWWP